MTKHIYVVRTHSGDPKIIVETSGESAAIAFLKGAVLSVAVSSKSITECFVWEIGEPGQLPAPPKKYTLTLTSELSCQE